MLTFPQKMTILPRLVNISPKKVMFTPKYVDLRALSSVVASRIYALFVVKSTRVPRLGGGGQANLGNARIFTVFCMATPPLTFRFWAWDCWGRGVGGILGSIGKFWGHNLTPTESPRVQPRPPKIPRKPSDIVKYHCRIKWPVYWEDMFLQESK